MYLYILLFIYLFIYSYIFSYLYILYEEEKKSIVIKDMLPLSILQEGEL